MVTGQFWVLRVSEALGDLTLSRDPSFLVFPPVRGAWVINAAAVKDLEDMGLHVTWCFLMQVPLGVQRYLSIQLLSLWA